MAKSITQEASSVIKAIEKAWEAAGKPEKFSIKVFEEPKKNFLGITVQSAKIGIFFDEKYVIEQEEQKEPVAKKKEYIPKQPVKKEVAPLVAKTEKVEVQKPVIKAAPKSQIKESEKQQKIVWTPEMITLVQQWLSQTLALLNFAHVPFSIETSHYQLLVTFNKPILQIPEKEHQLLRSFSLLLIQTLRHALKRPLRGFKIIMRGYASSNT